MELAQIIELSGNILGRARIFLGGGTGGSISLKGGTGSCISLGAGVGGAINLFSISILLIL